MHETTAFGAALAAGIAIGVWDLKAQNSIPINFETFNSTISDEGQLTSLYFELYLQGFILLNVLMLFKIEINVIRSGRMQLKEAWDGTMKDPLVRKEIQIFDAASAEFLVNF